MIGPCSPPLIGAQGAHALQQAGNRAGLAQGGDAHLLQGGDGFGAADGVDQFEFECGEIGHLGRALAGLSDFVTLQGAVWPAAMA